MSTNGDTQGRPSTPTTPLSPSRASAWYNDFCLTVAQQTLSGDNDQIDLRTVQAQLDIFLHNMGVVLPKRTKETLARRAQFEINLPTQVRRRSYSV